MIVFVERQTLLEGRGVFLPSFPDLGTASVAGALDSAGIPFQLLEGTWRWVEPFLSPVSWSTRLAMWARIQGATEWNWIGILPGGMWGGQGSGGLLDRSVQDEIYATFQRNYDSLTSGRRISFPDHFSTARSLLAFLYR